ncbi:hypothetical protein BDR26DRAFT_849456 [Obelidium mucronatum]|nr:hypothetical protein BDR26DRAFT_849456 [Obelidium mucronatum]
MSGQPEQQDRGIIGDTWGNMSHLQRFGAEVAVAGVGYMAYDRELIKSSGFSPLIIALLEWRKHHDKPHSDQSQSEYQTYATQYNPNQAAPWLQPGGQQQQQQQQYQQQGPPQGQLPPGWVIQFSQKYQTNFYQQVNDPQGPPPSFQQQQQQQQQYQPQHPQAPPPHHGGGIGETWNNMSHLQRFGAEAAVVGVGYLGYQAWLKHSGKQHSREAEVEYEHYSRGI